LIRAIPDASYGLRKLYLVIEFGKANHVAAAAAAVAVEQAFEGVHQKAELVVSVQRTQAHKASAADARNVFRRLERTRSHESRR
jgi:hypothetical protein